MLQRLKSKIFLGEPDSEDEDEDEDVEGGSLPTTAETKTGAGDPASDNGKKKHDHHRHHRHHRHGKHGRHPLSVAIRCHANFVEHVPLALMLAAVAELNGGNKQVLTLSLGGLLIARVLHVEFGLRNPGSTGMGRAVGYYGTMGTLGFLAGYAGWLVKDYWLAPK